MKLLLLRSIIIVYPLVVSQHGSAIEISLEDPTNPFQKGYLSIELLKTNPEVQSMERFNGGFTTYSLGYRHNLNRKWLLGIHVNYKSLIRNRVPGSAGDPVLAAREREQRGKELGLFSVNHESFRIVRISHPLYFMIGPKLIYFVPGESSSYPLVRDKEYKTGFGVGLSMMLVRHIGEKAMVHFRLDRWKDTTTNRFHIFESAFGYSHGI